MTWWPTPLRSGLGVPVVICALAVATIAATWPRPALTIVVHPGGSAAIRPRFAARWRSETPLPLRLEVDRNALVRVVNEDTAWARLGIFSAPPHSDESARGPSVPGAFAAACSAHPGRRLVIVVR